MDRGGRERFSIYVHIPYCQSKCPYCDFNSYAAASWPETAYVSALKTELHEYAARPPWSGGIVQSIFFGGGTPSLFEAVSIASILDEITALWKIDREPEVTLEANPGTVTTRKLSELRAGGVNRLSFGVQSFLNHHLQRLGRIHDAEQARDAVRQARSAGFESINIDLMYALPRQTLDEWRHDLAEAVHLGTPHLSAYNLTYEEGTVFHQLHRAGKLRSLDEEIEVELFEMTQEILGHAGLRQYEISNYARPGQECRHNLNYWQGGSYSGVGAGAHGFARSGGDGYGMRWSNERSPSRYLERIAHDGHARVTEERLGIRQAQGEFVFLGLRCRTGFPDSAFRARFGRAFKQTFPQVPSPCETGLLVREEGCWRLTARGLLVADSIFAGFL